MIEIDHSTWVPPQSPETGPVPTLGPKKPEEVLAYYEGPLTMTLAVDGSLHLLHCLDDPVDRLLYFAAPTTPDAIADMLAGRVSYLDCLTNETNFVILFSDHAFASAERIWRNVPLADLGPLLPPQDEPLLPGNPFVPFATTEG